MTDHISPVTVTIFATGDNENTPAEAVHHALEYARKAGFIEAWSDPVFSAQQHDGPNPLRVAMARAIDLLTERTYGSPARSPGHNASLVLEAALAAPVASTNEDTTKEFVDLAVSLSHTERHEIEARIAVLEAANEAATEWGAAVGARHEEITELKARLSALSLQDSRAPDWVAADLADDAPFARPPNRDEDDDPCHGPQDTTCPSCGLGSVPNRDRTSRR